ncbi:LLM class F420-dependent oxidoreductase [Actinobacteria bacterium YIM 96077]|uniref:LLM class F420-dependent oxidoreductase n=1 Tax=Phytoactinopolyspora halophila TaxID=1981511 RepID=A0A329QQW8_9ACTN|nr:LLM class F420-dependent oxidoreductase [Phytoactinopolyspora halophila]AYY14202.1 LLM class F420-dependent oxidoreductase [Actinobacteria bacterium YIM 96077]RAW14744.1 LLM class F420-dependent oxidoreductase [Phytoactinopolyspora halophila]
MRYGLKLSQKASIDEYRAVWRIADDEGFDHCWNMDHLATLGADPTGDIFEAWTHLAAMAEATTRTRIGCMVTGNTYRHPAVLAKMAVTVDHLSGGRLEFGLGAAWAENEHTMLGLEFGTVKERMDRLEEACQIIRSLWTTPRTSFEGQHYQLDDAIAEPKPVQQPHPPIWIGGIGRKRTLRIVARYADVWNAAFGTPEDIADLSAVLDQHCAEVGRDPAEIRRTVQLRLPDKPEDVIPQIEAYAQAGVSDIVMITMGGTAERQAEQVASLLPRLRAIG